MGLRFKRSENKQFKIRDYSIMPLLILLAGFSITLISSIIYTFGKLNLVGVLFLAGSIVGIALSIRQIKAEKKRPVNKEILESKPPTKITYFLASSIDNDILRSGRPISSIAVTRQYMRYSVISIAVVVPLIFFVIYLAEAEMAEFNIKLKESQIKDSELFTADEEELKSLNRKPPSPFITVISPYLIGILVATPPLLLFYPKIYYKSMRRNRKSTVEEELPFFGLYASVLQSVGMSLYTAFIITIGKGIFRAMEQEAMLLKRNVEVFARSPLEAFEEIGRTHDSLIFRNFLLGYTSIARSGGDLSRYLETRSAEYFELLKIRYSAFSRNVAYIVEALIVIFVVVPLLVIITAFVLPAATISQLITMSAVVVPLFTIVFAVILANIQPKTFNIIGLSDQKVMVFFPVAMVSFLIFTLAGVETWIALAIAAIIPSIINEYVTTRHKIQIERMESALPNFLRDVTEYRKIGFNEINAIIRISREIKYNKTFDKLLVTIARLLEQGYTPTQILKNIKIRSWFARVSFFTLAQIAESGGGSPAVLESLTGFITNMRIALKEAKASMSMYSILGYASPIILAFTVIIIDSMLSSITPGLLGEGRGQFDQLVTVTPLFKSIIKSFIITSSIGTGILLGKAIDGTFKSTGRIAVLCILAIVSLFANEYISIPGLSEIQGLSD